MVLQEKKGLHHHLELEAFMVVCTKLGEKQLLDSLEHVCGSRTNPKDATDEQLQLARKRVDPHDTINVVELVLGMREEAKKKAQAEQIAQAERAAQQEAAAEEAAAKDAQRIRDAQAEAAAAEKQVQKEIAESERVIAERDRAMESSRAALESNPGAFASMEATVPRTALLLTETTKTESIKLWWMERTLLQERRRNVHIEEWLRNCILIGRMVTVPCGMPTLDLQQQLDQVVKSLCNWSGILLLATQPFSKMQDQSQRRRGRMSHQRLNAEIRCVQRF